MSEANISGNRQGILSLSIKDKTALYAAYIPFIKNGGLFIPTKRDYTMGEEVFMLLNLMEETDRLPIAGKIIRITQKALKVTEPRGLVYNSANRMVAWYEFNHYALKVHRLRLD